MDANTIFEMKKIREELNQTNRMLLRIAKALEERNERERSREEVCEGKNE